MPDREGTMPSCRHLRSLGGARPPYLRLVARPGSGGGEGAVSGPDWRRLVSMRLAWGLWLGVSRVGVANGGEGNADRGHDERYARPEAQEHGSQRRADEE